MARPARAGGIPPVVILYGKSGKIDDYFDEFAAGEHLSRLKSESPGGTPSVSEYDASNESTDLADVLDELFTPALWGGERFIILRKAEAILAPAAEDKGRAEAAARRLLSALTAKPQGRLALVATGLDIQKGAPRTSFRPGQDLIEAVSEAEGLFSCVPPYESELKRSLAQKAVAAGVRLPNDAAEALVAAVGAEQMAANEELDKLLAACSASKIITVDDVEMLVAGRAQTTAFALADSILDGDAASALAALRRLREMPGTRSSAYILGIVTSTFRRYLEAALKVEDGLSPQAAAAASGTPRSKVGGFAARMAKWNSRALAALLERPLACDVEIKSGSAWEEIALEAFVLDAARRRLRKADLVGRWIHEI